MFRSMDLTLKISQLLMLFHKVLLWEHFLLYIKDLDTAIKFCQVHHFADDINLLRISNIIKGAATDMRYLARSNFFRS